MGLLSLFKSKSSAPVTPTVPSIEEQQANAKKMVDSFISTAYVYFDKEGDQDVETAYFRIAGITNYCSKKNVGMIQGFAFSDKNNPVDKSAIALGAYLGTAQISKIYGYIAREDKAKYKKFADGGIERPFFGYIREFVTSEGKTGIMGQVKFYKSEGRKTYQMMIDDAQLLEGVFKGYYKDQTLKEREEKPEWVLDRHF